MVTTPSTRRSSNDCGELLEGVKCNFVRSVGVVLLKLLAVLELVPSLEQSANRGCAVVAGQ